MIHRFRPLAFFIVIMLAVSSASAQDLPPQANQHAYNRPLPSLHDAADYARGAGMPFNGMVREIPNNKAFKADTRTQTSGMEIIGDMQTSSSSGSAANSLMSFDGADNDDNAELLGYHTAPPDPDGDVGPNHYVQMVNAVTTVFDRAGNPLGGGPFPNNAFWAGMGGLCEDANRGDPIVVYDEAADRWIVSQFAYMSVYSAPYLQCVAVSQTGDPLGGFNRYAFEFSTLGFNDYPKLGVATDAITLMVDIFEPPSLTFRGAFLGALDKQAMYAGEDAGMVGELIDAWGFATGDLDDPSGSAGHVPALFATAMVRPGFLDIWQLDPDFVTGTADVRQVAGIAIDPFDSDLCSAGREACIPQPEPGFALEALSSRLMHRFAIRDFGAYQVMMAAHTVDVGGGRAGIRWYEVRRESGNWLLHQQNTFAPNDGLHRWMPSIAMNATGDIGLGYLVASTDHFMSIGVTGQTAGASGSGVLDADEILCVQGTGVQTNTSRAGDYSSTRVDPITDSFWHTNEYGRETGNSMWATRVCEFTVEVGTGTPPEPPPPGPETVEQYIDSIETGTVSGDKGQKYATATVSLMDNLGSPVSGAYVSGWFSGDFVESGGGTTAADGSLVFQTSEARKIKGDGTIRFCVSVISHPDLVYNPDLNPNPTYQCSVGTSIDDNPDVHVDVVKTSARNGARGSKKGMAEVTIRDNQGFPVSGYRVSGSFFGDISEGPIDAVTDHSGVASFRTVSTTMNGSNIAFCVGAVTGEMNYDPSDNADPTYDCASGNASVLGFAETWPTSFTLEQNYPNPFNPTTIIPFNLMQSTPVRLAVFDVLGRQVELLTDEVLPPGMHRVAFDASRLPAGVYLYVLESGAEREVRRMTLVK